MRVKEWIREGHGYFFASKITLVDLGQKSRFYHSNLCLVFFNWSAYLFM